MVQQLEKKTGISCQQVYASDILLIKQFFNKLKGSEKNEAVGDTFGIPFMMAKLGDELIAFASFTLDGGVGNLSFYQKATVDISKMAEWKSRVVKEASFHPYSSLKDKALLKSSIRQFTEWLNKANQ